ncbi:unnamed protein product [Enterobius vermicularis]|uniref:DUF3715 domain-containing protein n=1 Tax=Enterobius vermicularis TaxID=51028 RepID=A0A0N4V6W4_ENTVE|nr:unnamed protein product [Enterobius vermicularis]
MFIILDQYLAEITEKPQITSSAPKVFQVAINSDMFHKSFGPVFMGRLSQSCSNKEGIKISSCMGVSSEVLERKFNNFRKQLEDAGLPSEVSYGFMALSGIQQQAKVIVEHGLRAGNFVVGEVGNAEKGVYLIESPDLVVPSAFFESTVIRIMCFKVLKGRSRVVDLGSYKVEPSFGYNSHIPPPVKNRKLSRYFLHRSNQVFLFETLSSGKLSLVPSNVLPYGIFTVEFPPTVSLRFNVKLSEVWKGSLKSGAEVFHHLRLSSIGGVLLKPLSLHMAVRHILGIAQIAYSILLCKLLHNLAVNAVGSFKDFNRVKLFELHVPALVDWSTCLKFPFIQELLSPTSAGELGLKKELFLANSKHYVSYYVLTAAQENPRFVRFVEMTQAHRVVGYQILDSDAHLILIPNGSLSMALSLPYRGETLFHCLHLSKESCVMGLHKPLSEREKYSDNCVMLLCLSNFLDGELETTTLDCEGTLKPDIVHEPVALEYSKKDVEENFENVDMDVDDPRPNAETADVKETTSYEKDSDQKPAKFRKTKVITSTSLTDPRLSISEYFKKRSTLAKGTTPPEKNEITVKKSRIETSDSSSKEYKTVTVKSRENENSAEVTSSTYAYQAPVPQVALVIEKMKDPKTVTSSDLAERIEERDIGENLTRSDPARDANLTENYSQEKNCWFGGRAYNESVNTTTPQESSSCSSVLMDEDERDRDTDLRFMQLSEGRLARIMSDLRMTASSVNEQMCQIGLIKKSTELAVGSRLTFAAHFSHTPEIATGKDMDYRLNDSSSTLMAPLIEESGKSTVCCDPLY